MYRKCLLQSANRKDLKETRGMLEDWIGAIWFLLNCINVAYEYSYSVDIGFA